MVHGDLGKDSESKAQIEAEANIEEQEKLGAIKKINSIVGELLDTSKTDAEKAIDDVAGKAKETIDKVGKNIDKSSVVQHERDDKAAYTKHKKEDAEKKDRKENPDKYKLKETRTEFQKYLQDRNELEKKQAREKNASTSTISPAAVESMELPLCCNLRKTTERLSKNVSLPITVR